MPPQREHAQRCGCSRRSHEVRTPVFLAERRGKEKMSLNRVLKSPNQREHSSQHTAGHKRDKLIGEQRRAEQWLLLPTPPPQQQVRRDFSAVRVRDFVADGSGKLSPVSPTDYVAHLEKSASDNRYVGEKSRNGKSGTSIRTCENPLAELTVTLSPAASDFLAIGAKANPKRVEEFLEELITLMSAEVEIATGAKIVGVTAHTDTDDVHLNFVVTRLARDRDGVQRLKTKKGFGTVGAWMVGLDRQRRAGIVYKPHDDLFVAALARFLKRGRPAVDLLLAQAMDALCVKMLPGLTHFIVAYAARVNESRRNGVEQKKTELRAQLAALDRAEHSISNHNESSKTIPRAGMDK
jgi:hypothetical protein